jgi:hypothetical protein
MWMWVLVACVALLGGATLVVQNDASSQAMPMVAQPVGQVTPTRPPGQAVQHSLIDLLPAELAQYALNFALTERELPITSGTPEVLLARHILAREFAPLGLPDLRGPDNDPPLVLAVLRGNFLTTRIIPYVAFVFDARTGAMTHMWGSWNGARFRYVLNDPSLPEDPDVRPATPQPRLAGGVVPAEITFRIVTPSGTSLPATAVPTP